MICNCLVPSQLHAKIHFKLPADRNFALLTHFFTDRVVNAKTCCIVTVILHCICEKSNLKD